MTRAKAGSGMLVTGGGPVHLSVPAQAIGSGESRLF